MDQLTKIETKLLKAQQKEHKRKYKKVRSKIRRIKPLKREDKKVLIADLSHVNGDLMNVLYYCEQFTSVADYFDTINAYIRSESDCYNYKLPGYIPSAMSEVMEMIRNHHNNMDRYNDLKSKIMGTNG